MTTNVDAPIPGAPEVADSSADSQKFLSYVAKREGRDVTKGEEDKPSEAPATSAKASATPAAEKKNTPDSEPGDEQDEPDGADVADQPKRKGGFQRRIEKLQADKRALEAQLAERGSAVPKPDAAKEKPETAPAVTGKPKLEDFDSLEAFSEALTDWKLDQRDKIARAADEEQKQKAAHQELAGKWKERSDAARKEHPDYDQVLESVNDIRISDDLQRLFLEDEQGPELAYALASNPEELERLARLPLVAAAKEIGKLAARLDPAHEEKKERTRAPKPPTTVGRGSGHTAPKLGDPQTDFLTFVKLRGAA